MSSSSPATVHLAALGLALPDESVSSTALEERLEALYERLGLRVGRLELMSGIRERRFWPAGTRPSEVAARAGEDAIQRAGIDRKSIGCLIHASVCRDVLEPASASFAHQTLGLSPHCTTFDLSNACLGVANAMVLVKDMITSGRIEAGLIIAGEDGRPLVERTIQALLEDKSLNRREIKQAFASLTIGSGAAAVLLCRGSEHSPARLLGSRLMADSAASDLCRGDRVEGGAPLMETDSEALMQAGCALAQRTWPLFLQEMGWASSDVDRVVTHQVGTAHRRLLLDSLSIDPAIDFPTVERFGNVGSVSLPLSLALAVRAGHITTGHRVAMLGIGSGLNCLMLGVEW